jgi:hypothetical protein
MAEKKRREISIKATDEVLRGAYANNMVVSHTREEFFLDFINVLPPTAILSARVIISLGHMKGMIRALNDNVAKYEGQFGAIREAPEPKEMAKA